MTDRLRVANMLLTEAEAEAYKIRAEAHAVRNHAAAQAEAVREAAARDAAKVRASLNAMSAELNQVASFVTQRLAIPGYAEPDIDVAVPRPEVEVPRPEVEVPRPEPRARTAPPPTRTQPSRPGPARKVSAPATKPDTARKVAPSRPAGPPRQLKAAKVVVTAMAALLMFGVVAGTTELFLHGGPFFVFRAAGTGATHGGLEEDQGPGQPDAPGTHHHSAPRQHHKEHHVRQAKQHSGGSPH